MEGIADDLGSINQFQDPRARAMTDDAAPRSYICCRAKPDTALKLGCQCVRNRNHRPQMICCHSPKTRVGYELRRLPRSMHHKGSVRGDVSSTLQSNGSSIWVHSDWRYEIPCNLKLHVYVFQTTYLTGMEPGASVELGFKSVSNHSASCSSQAKLEVTTRRMRAMYYYIEWLAPRS